MAKETTNSQTKHADRMILPSSLQKYLQKYLRAHEVKKQIAENVPLPLLATLHLDLATYSNYWGSCWLFLHFYQTRCSAVCDVIGRQVPTASFHKPQVCHVSRHSLSVLYVWSEKKMCIGILCHDSRKYELPNLNLLNYVYLNLCFQTVLTSFCNWNGYFIWKWFWHLCWLL